MDQFVCVRMVRMNGVDLNQFQFDYDQTWAVLFLRHDGTVIARYGTRADKDGMKLNSLGGFTHTMRVALEVHRQWEPSMAKDYAGKRGPPVAYRTAEEIPSETMRNIVARGNEGQQGCVHCHNVYDARRDDAIRRGQYDPAGRFKYPLPQNIGLQVDPESGQSIQAVTSGSPAEQAGLREGQVIQRMQGQPIHSLADIQFVLHHLGESARLRVWVTGPGAKQEPHLVTLDSGWRVADIGWRASMYGMPPKPGLWVQGATDAEKSQLDLKPNQCALKVRGTFGREVRAAGLMKGDVIVAFDGITSHHTEGAFHAHLRLHHYQPQSRLPLTVLRGGERRDLTVIFANTP